MSGPLHHEAAKSSTALASSPSAEFEARVAQLSQLYAGHPATASSQWSREYVASEIDPVNFRADNAYVWQRFHGDDTYERSYRWLAEHEGDLLARCTEDGAFGAHCVSIDGKLISRDLLDAVAELGFLQSEFGDLSSLSVLDIGAGYGRLAYRAAEVAPGVRFTCTDAIPESTALSEKYLAYRGVQTATVVPLNDIAAALSRTRIDVAVNIHSFPECPPPAIEWWLQLLADHEIRYLFLVPAFISHLYTTEGSDRDLVPLLTRYGYRLEATRLKYRDRRFTDADWVFQDSHHLFVRRA